MTASHAGLVTRNPGRLDADTARVITRLFVPGQEGFEQQESRAGVVVTRILGLTDGEVQVALDDVITRFSGRHRDLEGIFRKHARELADRIRPGLHLSDDRILLLGATFTSEYAIEGAALCNPSMVPHPDQSGVPSGALRFVMSVRGIGEGHRSSIGFRTGVVNADGVATLDAPVPYASTGRVSGVLLDAVVFRAQLGRLDNAAEATNYVFDALGAQFTRSDLDERLADLRAHLRTRGHAERTLDHIHTIAACFYSVEFPVETALSERVLWPATPAEQAGMEDARFVRFVEDDGSVTYYATYTAYSGSVITQQLLATTDFQSFTSSPLVGTAAANKGLALFPRRIGGRYVAMSRSDRETNTVAFAENPAAWFSASSCQQPNEAWEVLQLGNCGSPIETTDGWLVLTHGVGPMRTYSIGAILLDIDDPTIVLGRLRRPLLTPGSEERNGYVPNVVYSCGALLHGDALVIPYGMADCAIGFATVFLPDLLTAMRNPN